VQDSKYPITIASKMALSSLKYSNLFAVLETYGINRSRKE